MDYALVRPQPVSTLATRFGHSLNDNNDLADINKKGKRVRTTMGINKFPREDDCR